ncbi:MAG: hypothetical protein LYZ70_05595 [Nitrososphaerales archaeon]|nr:hypothetical protein [Nitrososphaerales archaeon]
MAGGGGGKFMLILMPLVIYGIIVWYYFGSFNVSPYAPYTGSNPTSVGCTSYMILSGIGCGGTGGQGVLQTVIANIGIGSLTVFSMLGLILAISLIGTEVTVLGNSIQLKGASVHMIVMVVPLAVVYGFLFAAALPFMATWPVGLGTLLNAFLAFPYIVGMLAMASYG